LLGAGDEVKDFKDTCEQAVASFLRGNFTRFGRDVQSLETVKVGNIRSLLNQEE